MMLKNLAFGPLLYARPSVVVAAAVAAFALMLVPVLLLVLYFGFYQLVGVFAAGTVVGYLEETVFGQWVMPPLAAWLESWLPFPALRDLLVGEYGVLTLTEASNQVLFEGRQVMLRREPERVKPAKAVRAKASGSASRFVELAPADAGLFERLRVWRAATAKEQGVPAYVVFHDATLREIAARKPATLADLGTVSGVGESKLAKYGEGVVAVVAGSDGESD